MKRRLNKLPIKTKIVIISVLTCLVALLLAGGVIAFYDNYLYQQRKLGEISAQAEIIASSMSASLEFHDAKAAHDYLRPLEANSQILVGAVYDEKGRLFASYSRDPEHKPPTVEPIGIELKSAEFGVSRPVVQDERKLGSVYLRSSIESLSTRLTRYTGTFLLAMAISLLITLPIAMRLHYSIANPVYARSLIEASQDPLVTISTEGKIMDVNDATTQATGVSREKLIGTDFSAYFTDPLKAREGYRRVFEEGHVTDFPLTLQHVDGRMIDVLYNASVYKDEHGRVLGVVAAARDVTSQKAAEREIQRRTAELQAANQELEAFSYSVSHDLRAPLRAIDGFSLALMEDFADKLDDTARNYLDRVRAATQRMGLLIDDMLALSRITRAEMRRETVNLSDMAKEVLAELQKGEPNRKVECKVQEGLQAEGDPH
ncbi:MAG TPA: PAS domain S-box protein, partial [Methylophilaceae bacterium]|nr:PAS domain S-box protein [Methylophilaceae bacterium]